MRHSLLGSFVLMAAMALVACSGAGSNPTSNTPGDPSTPLATCAPPPPGPTPIPAWLDYPPNGSTGIATSVGQLIERGVEEPGQNNSLLIVLTSQSGTNVPVGAPTAAPSPLPTPFATPPPNYPITGPYVAIPLPTLSPTTTYEVSDTYTGWSDSPPQCTAQYSQPVGSFTTGTH